jgi:hypothetical protein
VAKIERRTDVPFTFKPDQLSDIHVEALKRMMESLRVKEVEARDEDGLLRAVLFDEPCLFLRQLNAVVVHRLAENG